MYKLEIKLKQHTPLIHFQHDQEDATLRASEVKPKLDKYIIKHAFHDNFNECKQYLVGYNPKTPDAQMNKFESGYRALNYKMRIVAKKRTEYLIGANIGSTNIEDKPEGLLVLPKTSYFAQEQENKNIVTSKKIGDIRQYTFHSEFWDKIPNKGLIWGEIKMEIFSLNTFLINEMKNYISFFFLCTNFGTRSDKGFGGFTISEINGEPVNNDKDELEKAFKTTYSFCYMKDTSSEQQSLARIFELIKNDYQSLKAGINAGKRYQKSLLFCYAIEKMKDDKYPRWEKRHFKKKMRDLLGNGSVFDRDSRKIVDVSYELKVNERRPNTDPIRDSCGTQSWEDEFPYTYMYLRAVLGVADHYEFMMQGKIINEGKTIPLTDRKVIVTLDGGSDLKRFQSPILFKVINNNIYLLGNEPTAILNKSFNINYEIVHKDRRTNNTTKVRLPIDNDMLETPTAFSLADFMDYAVRKGLKNYTKIL